MPRAIRERASKQAADCDADVVVSGVLIECDPSIKSIIVNIDSENHDFIIEDLDEERVVVKENTVHLLKQKLEDVRISIPETRPALPCASALTMGGNAPCQRLKENLPPLDESGSEA
ncbi:Nucleotide excision repair, TFIIH, subunit TTDA [Moelleriella libera RCEF 2490]|uniref:General transcription and DNA repair factor IIH subunit TFB5 n=1 Tax=Moelleriella libera RCEF 2490 TaxID=1081109 RepID=A0A166V8E4_9HYPO|nr:Nucleotide excision repair, TFIIH, subunit TTDA [Moelleriella libera RCEF 2490]